jgi:outer membrane protein OmpA-like peptidoglycan-associated protein
MRLLSAVAVAALLAMPAFAQAPSPRQAEFAAAAAGPNAKNPQSGDTVLFTFKQTYLTKTAVEVVQRQGAWLKQNPVVRVVLECHTDDDYPPEYALSFGEARCQQVERVLMKAGVEAGRITAVSYGNQRPAVANAASKEDHAKNRRVVTRLVE